MATMRTAVRPRRLWAIAVCGMLGSADAATPAPPAKDILRQTGVPAGLSVVVGTTDGTIEADLTNDGKMLVQGLALSDEAASRARKSIFEKKLYGLASVSVVKTAATLPYYDRLVNLLVADLDALGKEAPPATEIDRVLGYEGVSYLKKGGQWTKTVKPTPKEVDVWTHYAYDASGNPVSKDLVVGPPNTFRWVDGPFGMNLVGGLRTSDGVAVQINPAYLILKNTKEAKIPPGLEGLHLWARDVNSGVLLWHRPILPKDARYRYEGTYTETFVAAEGRVFFYDFTNEDRIALTALNLKTGVVERAFDQGVVCRKADWPGSSEKNAHWQKWANDTFAWSMVLAHDGKVVQIVQNQLVVMDAATGGVAWRKKAGDGTSYLKGLMSGGRLVALEAKIERDSKLGRKLNLVAAEAWRWKDGTPLWRIDLSGLTYPSAHEIVYHQNFAAQEPYLLLPLDGRILLLDGRDGKRLWEKPTKGRFGHHIIKDKIFMDFAGSTPFGGVVFLATGDRDPTPRDGGKNQSACDAGTATLNWFMGKRNFVPVDPGADSFKWISLRCMGKKCGERAAASYGSIYGVSPMCGCDQFIRGTGAFYAVQPAAPTPDEGRLSKGGAGALGPVVRQVEAQKSLLASFWGAPEGVPSFWFTTNFRWSNPIYHWPGYALTQTEPVTAGDLTLRAYAHEHRLAASRGGKEEWNFVAGGRVSSAPAIHGDRALFGCHDGSVYALNLKDGSLAWRFLAAPADLRHMVLGQLESAWPVFNVVLDGGKLYCSAGRHEEMEGGIHFYCLDAATGAIRWHVKRRRGLESNLEPIRERKNTGDDQGKERLQRGVLSDGRAQMNDRLELRDGQLRLHDVPMVDVAAPKDAIMYPQALVPPQLKK
jgi:outer membrane protein assembly factor BamB